MSHIYLAGVCWFLVLLDSCKNLAMVLGLHQLEKAQKSLGRGETLRVVGETTCSLGNATNPSQTRKFQKQIQQLKRLTQKIYDDTDTPNSKTYK